MRRVKPSVFICYRRTDTALHAHQLASALKKRWGTGHVFIDDREIVPGADFPQELEGRIRDADFVLVIIGDNWLGSSPSGRIRIEEPDDWVRWEIRARPGVSKKIVPVLVEGAQMPGPEQLPEDIRAMATKMAWVIADRTFDQGVQYLARSLEQRLPRPKSTWIPWTDSVSRVGWRRLLIGAMTRPVHVAALVLLVAVAWREETPWLVGAAVAIACYLALVGLSLFNRRFVETVPPPDEGPSWA